MTPSWHPKAQARPKSGAFRPREAIERGFGPRPGRARSQGAEGEAVVGHVGVTSERVPTSMAPDPHALRTVTSAAIQGSRRSRPARSPRRAPRRNRADRNRTRASRAPPRRGDPGAGCASRKMAAVQERVGPGAAPRPRTRRCGPAPSRRAARCPRRSHQRIAPCDHDESARRAIGVHARAETTRRRAQHIARRGEIRARAGFEHEPGWRAHRRERRSRSQRWTTVRQTPRPGGCRPLAIAARHMRRRLRAEGPAPASTAQTSTRRAAEASRSTLSRTDD